MKRLLLTVALSLYAMFAFAGCCPCLWGTGSGCSTCTSLLPGILLPLVVEAPAPAAPDSALVSTQTPQYDEQQSTCTADNPLPF